MDAESAADPILAYRALLEAGQIRPDPSQALAMEKLQGLHEDLCAYTPQMGKKGWMKRLSLGRNKVPPPQGLYLWGGVGRGKSMLMDMFFDTAAIDAAIQKMIAHNRKTAKTHSGIWRDLAVRKRKTEVDAQIGVMVDLGREAGISVPTLARMVDLIHDIEDGKREQSADLVDQLVAA